MTQTWLKSSVGGNSEYHSDSSKAKWPWTNTNDWLKKFGLRLEKKPESTADLSWFISGSNKLTKPHAEAMHNDIRARRIFLTKIGVLNKQSGSSSGTRECTPGSPLAD